MATPFDDPFVPGAASGPDGPAEQPGKTSGQLSVPASAGHGLGHGGVSPVAALARTVDWGARPGFLVVVSGALLAVLGLLPLLSFVMWLLTVLITAVSGTAAWTVRQQTIPEARLRVVAIWLGAVAVLTVILLLAGVSTDLGIVGYVLVLLGLLAVAAGAAYEVVNMGGSTTVAASPRSTPSAGPTATAPEPNAHRASPPLATSEAPSVGPVGDSMTGSEPGQAAGSSSPPAAVRPAHWVSHAWCLVAIAGGVLALIGFFALPLVSLPLFGSLTGAQVTSLASQSADYGSGLGWIGVFWLLPVFAVVAIALAAWTGCASTAAAGEGRGALILGVCGVAAGVLQLIGVLALSNHGLGFAISGGAWLTLIAFLAVAVGGFVEYSKRRAAMSAPSEGGRDPNSPQAPPNSVRRE